LRLIAPKSNQNNQLLPHHSEPNCTVAIITIGLMHRLGFRDAKSLSTAFCMD
jgi:hypothetical protein